MNVTTVRTKARASSSSFTLEVGPWDQSRFDGKGGFAFGETAEVQAFTPLRQGEKVEFEVSFSAIGSHDPETAKRRIASYKTAIQMAEQFQALVNEYTEPASQFESLARDYDGQSYMIVFN